MKPSQMVFPFADDPNYCTHCKSTDRLKPNCLHKHQATRPVVFSACDCDPNNRKSCLNCRGLGYTYLIVNWDEYQSNPKGKQINGIFHPYSNVL